MTQCEFIVFLRKGNAKRINNCSISDVLEFNVVPSKNKTHPTQKPIDLLKVLIENSSQENDLVFDPFSGTGSTAIACKQLNRCFLGCEIDIDFYNIAMQKLQGKTIEKKNQLNLF